MLDWKAREIGELLDTSVSAVNSALRRARVKVAGFQKERKSHKDKERAFASLGTAALSAKMEARLRDYMKAWRDGDAASLALLLKKDASFSMPPVPTWYSGREEIRHALEVGIFAEE